METYQLEQATRRRIAVRLLPFVFLMYVINYVDRVNVSFANLRMSAELHFTDRVFGLGAGIFFVGYVLFEIPGAIIVERWSARKWMARIMISWGLVTAFTGFVQTAHQFYIVRFLLGVAEASFLPGMIVYLTHWFRLSDRAKALASFYVAVPAASVLGSVLAGWLLSIRWFGMPLLYILPTSLQNLVKWVPASRIPGHGAENSQSYAHRSLRHRYRDRTAILLPCSDRRTRTDTSMLASGQWWRLITPILINPEGWSQIVFNLPGIAIVGFLVERIFGSARWLILYLTGAVVGELAGRVWKPVGAGSSVAICGLLGGLAVSLLWRRLPTRARFGGAMILLGALMLTGMRNLHGPPLIAGALAAAVMLSRDAPRAGGA